MTLAFACADVASARDGKDKTGAAPPAAALDQLPPGQDVADTVTTEGAKAMKAAGEKAEDAYAATKRFVQDQPYVAIGAVVVAACAVGALWRLSSSRRAEGDLLNRLQSYVEPGVQALRRRI